MSVDQLIGMALLASATRALRRGVSIVAVSKILGHSSVKVTDESYSHLVVDDLAAELELLEV